MPQPQIGCTRAHSRNGHLIEAKTHDCTNAHATRGPRLRMFHAKWPGTLARGSPVKNVRHRRSEPGNTRLNQDY
eukprot:2245373-Lingulodinium_polyedra.AAC.1